MESDLLTTSAFSRNILAALTNSRHLPTDKEICDRGQRRSSNREVLLICASAELFGIRMGDYFLSILLNIFVTAVGSIRPVRVSAQGCRADHTRADRPHQAVHRAVLVHPAGAL